VNLFAKKGESMGTLEDWQFGLIVIVAFLIGYAIGKGVI
jgi:hypothetical protein